MMKKMKMILMTATMIRRTLKMSTMVTTKIRMIQRLHLRMTTLPSPHQTMRVIGNEKC